MAKEEEKRISPAILIVPVALGLGLAVVAGLAFARAAPPKEYVCPYCGAKFSTEAEALAHIEMEHPEEPPIVNYTCTICGATFTTEEELDTHILAEHPEEEPEIPPTGQILDITWWDGANWRPITEPTPAYTYITHRFRVKNTGDAVGTFKVGYSWYSELMGRWEWSYSPSFNIEADTEGNIDWELISGLGTYTIAFHLFSNDNDVDSVEVTITVG
ncbi:hypothetical protein ES705_29586 [subsurface metagenome]